MTSSENVPLLQENPSMYGAGIKPGADPDSSERSVPPPPTQLQVWLSYIFCIIAGLFFIGCDVCIKFASSDFPVSSWQMNFVRGAVPLVLIAPVLCWGKINILGPPEVKTRLRMLAIACTSGTMLMCVFEAIDRLPFGDYHAIAFSSPVFTMILSIFLLKDHFGIYRGMVGIILTVGVVIISRPTALFPTDSDPVILRNNATANQNLTDQEFKKSADPLGIAFALTGALLSAWIAILARQISHIHFSVQVFWFSIGGLAVSLVGMLSVDTEPLFTTWTLTTWLLSTGQAVFALLGAVFLLTALRWISATKNKIVRSFQVVVSYVIQVLAFGTVPHLSDYFGALMIVMAVLGTVLEDKVVKRINCRYF